MNTHWTAESLEKFQYSVTSSFLMQLERKMESEGISQKQLAQRLGLSSGRVSQILNGVMDNFGIDSIIRYAKALGMSVSIVAYPDPDPGQTRGPVDSEIFAICWERQGQPLDFFDLEEPAAQDLDAPVSTYFRSTGTRTFLVETNGNIYQTDAWAGTIQQTNAAIKNVA
ncbi:MAG: helix-turn-helix domain-containing protein [Pyrinomonadaceae bacterium]